MKRIWISILALCALLASTAAAQTPAKKIRKQLLQSLDLTAAQKQQAKTITQNTKQQVQPLAAQIKQNRASLEAAIKAGDSAQIQQLSTSMGSLRGQVLALRSTGRSQFYALLTADQKAKASAFEQKARDVLGKQ
jgi:Spy/CpxP family protein refolding chaperone